MAAVASRCARHETIIGRLDYRCIYIYVRVRYRSSPRVCDVGSLLPETSVSTSRFNMFEASSDRCACFCKECS